jgi:hypothetical protein
MYNFLIHPVFNSYDSQMVKKPGSTWQASNIPFCHHLINITFI